LRLHVSRETTERLLALHDLLLKWNKRINLIGRESEPAIWSRHIEDSAQLWPLRPPDTRNWADLGSGAGFPGLVIAALAVGGGPHVTMVESDLRKCVFLGEAARAMEVEVTILNARIEELPPLGADVLSARALAPLDQLLAYVEKHRSPRGRGLFPKGRTVHKEIETAALNWRFAHTLHPSLTDPGAAIVEVGAVSHV
jgi:16S rRNA (guanine527-N7)-methyltransferase